MRILIFTQKIDIDDPILGFFHNWILKLSEKFQKISVICLEKGNYNLPENVKIYSLGKESGQNRIKYLKNFFNLILGLNREYDSVLVHMNQEYVLLGGFFWKLIGKKVYLWRNHKIGNLFTDIAVWMSHKVFCTSKFAYVAKYKKTKLMPVGIDNGVFNTELRIMNYESCKDRILFLGRISPIKNPDLLIEALDLLNKKGVNFICDFYGDALPKDKAYFNSIKTKVKNLNLKDKIKFYKAVPNYETPKIYSSHEIFVNLTPSGSFDKTILEAAACGCLPVIINKSLGGEIEEILIAENTAEDVATKINFWIEEDDNRKNIIKDRIQEYILEKHSLNILVDKLYLEINKQKQDS
ncbi:MAG: glycosyltransferase family 4 protein [Candidatus Zambryskibacteria bacterium]|nr:glycosyltransferase family 4 protein [Candidatus Zambryskibacteria bacterium]